MASASLATGEEGGVDNAHAACDEVEEGVAEALREAASVADSVAKDVLDDVRVAAIGRYFRKFEPDRGRVWCGTVCR